LIEPGPSIADPAELEELRASTKAAARLEIIVVEVP
jgi:hypothetical protein